MRIYRRAEFLKLPPGTMYHIGGEWFFEKLAIKDESTDYNDWFCVELGSVDSNGTQQWIARMEDMLKSGMSFPMDTAVSRDGCFDDSAIFLVYEREDLVTLRAYVDAALGVVG